MVRIGIIGAGRMGNAHAGNLSGIPDVKIAAVYDPKESAAKAMNEKYGAKICSGPEELANLPEIDCVVISSPTYCHQDGIRAAIAAKKHIFCEKPLCRDPKLAQDMLNLGKGYDKIFVIGFVRRHMTKSRKLKEMLDQGLIGKLRFCNVDLPFGGFIRKEGDWFVDFEKSGGVIIDMLAHHVDLANWFFGPAKRVYAESHMLAKEPGVDPSDFVSSIVTYRNGVVCNLMCTWQRFGRSFERMEIYGEKGSLTMEGSNSVTFCPLGGEKQVIDLNTTKTSAAGVEEVNVEDGYKNQMINLVANIKGENRPFPLLQDGYNSLMVGMAMIESSKTHQVIAL